MRRTAQLVAALAALCASGSGCANGTPGPGGSAPGGADAGPAVCGDGVIADAEECDDGNAAPGDGCDASCAVESGFSCKGAPSKCATTCGDGVTAGAEECDDANAEAHDGCDACKVEDGFACEGTPSVCTPTCGDGIIAGGEKCDDANDDDGDGCSATCQVEVGFACAGAPSLCSSTCGDGILASDESCDDGDHQDGDGCDASCGREAGWACTGSPSLCAEICGDGHMVGHEQCDDGGTATEDGCSATCQIEPGYTCGGHPSVCQIVCGDGVIAGTEKCDDANGDFGDGCSPTCQIEPGFTCAGAPSQCAPICGDGILAGEEACDDHNQAGGDGCSPSCAVEPGYRCLGAPSQCATVCGDGFVAGGEACDDGNTASGDGCSGTCTTEPGFSCSGAAPTVCAPRCGDALVVKGEQCDDGNTLSGDCCSATCQRESGCEIEVNDARSSANDLVVVGARGVVKGFISTPGDVDVYRVVVPAGAPTGSLTAATLDGPLVVDTCASNKLDTLVSIYDASGALLTSDNDGGPGYCSYAFLPAAPPGTYYVEVKSSPSSTKTYSYTLQVNGVLARCGDGVKQPGEQCDDGNLASGDGCSAACLVEGVPGEVEPNDAFAEADARAAGSPPVLLAQPTTVEGSIGVAGDHDLYQVQITQPSVVRFETFDGLLPDSCESAATRIRLWDAAQSAVGADTASGIGECAAITVHLAAGTYYAQVEAAQVSALIPTYFLRMSLPASDGAEAEPNDTFAAATALSGSEVVASGGHLVGADVDTYAISVPAGQSLRAEIIEGGSTSCESLGLDSRLTLYDAGGSQIDDDDDAGRGFCSLIDGTGANAANRGAHALPGGTYYLAVRASAGATASTSGSFDYRLVVTIRP